MNDVDKLAILKVLVEVSDNTQDAALTVYLNLAKKRILAKAFPFDYDDRDIPALYDFLQCEIAAHLWNKRGAEGQTAHSENGISRQYENGDVPESMLRGITPFCGTFSGAEEET